MTGLASNGYQLEAVAADGSSLLEFMENDADDWRFDLLAQDATFGNPVPVTEVISSLMTDGGLTTVKSFGNRTAVFLLTITAPDTAALADGEAALMSALDSTVALAWHNPFGVPSLFDVMAVWSEHVFDDFEEVARCKRTFRLTFECLPFARSEESVTIEWTSNAVELSPLTSMTGWTVVSGSASWVSAATPPFSEAGIQVAAPTTPQEARLRTTATVDDYLWFKVRSAAVAGALDDVLVKDVTINGTAVPQARLRGEHPDSTTHYFTVPVAAWRGESVTVEFTLTTGTSGGSTATRLVEFWTTSYPTATTDGAASRPRGIGVIDVIGSARTPCIISFTAPAGGAFVYTAPDPNVPIRDQGSAEAVYAKFTVSDAAGAEVTVGTQLMWFPPGDHRTNVGITDPQPMALNPNGVWPQQPTGQAGWDGGTTGVAAGASQWAYPVSARAAVSFFDTTGAKTLISPQPTAPEGYWGDAVTHTPHELHPGRCGFAVLDVNGDPIPATITYYPRWKHHAAQ